MIKPLINHPASYWDPTRRRVFCQPRDAFAGSGCVCLGDGGGCGTTQETLRAPRGLVGSLPAPRGLEKGLEKHRLDFEFGRGFV